MFRFALIDDNQDDLSHSKALVENYFSLHPDLAGALRFFSAPEELLAAAERKSFDVYLLDILMPNENGIQLGLKLRELNDQGIFIYLTSSPDFAIDSYNTRAFHYLLKPVEPERLFGVLDEAVGLLSKRREESAVVRCKEGMRKLALSQVIYVELFDRRLCCHLVGGEAVRSLLVRESFREEAAAFLAHPAFALCGVSYAVNLAHVTRLERERIHLRGELTIPLSRTYREKFTARWLDYHLEGEV